MASRDHRQLGQHYESLALAHLQAQGLKLLARNFSCRAGELDLVMWHDRTLVFVEVKYRKSSGYGGAAAAVTRSKQRKLTAAARFFMGSRGISENQTNCRFDVLAIDGPERQINWLQNAFQDG